MENGNTLNQMSTYDFSTPISVTLIFEESDEDTSQSIEISEVKLSNHARDMNHDDTINVRSTRQINHNESISATVNNLKSVNDKLIDDHEELNALSKKSKPQTKLPNYEEILKRKKYDLLSKENKTCRKNPNNINSYENQYHQNILNYIQDTSTLTQKNSRATHHEAFSTKSQQFNERVNSAPTNYLQDLLNTVSEHLTFILKLLETCMEIHRDKMSDPNIVKHTMNHYCRTKYHLFDLSYSTVVNIIIPKEHDSKFVLNFLDNTIKLANMKGIQCSYQQLVYVFHEMIKWAQQKMMQFNFQSTNNSPLLKQQHCKVRNQHNFEPGVSTVVNKTCIFKSGPPGSEIQINVRPEFLNIQNRRPEYPNYNHTGNNVTMQSTQGFNDLHSNQYAQTTHNVGNNYCQPYSFSDQKNPAVSNKINYQKSADRHTRNISSVLPSLPQPNPETGPRHHHGVTPANKSVYNQIPMGHLQRHAADQVDTTYQQDSTRSSVSRDSGFISPLNLNTNNDQPCNERVSEQWRPPVTPLITHVTSLNPNVSYICNGPCYVCGKNTKTKCLGCYKYYYCSHECQILDWNSHMAACDKR